MKLVIDIPDDLLETQFFCQYFGVWSSKLQNTFMNGFQLIDNHENEAYQQGYADGWKERFGEPERPHGELIYDMFDENYHCSECNRVCDTIYHFCPNCGADMREGGEEE